MNTDNLRLWMTFPMYENLYLIPWYWVVCSSWDHSPLEWRLGQLVSRLSVMESPEIFPSTTDFTDFTIVRGSIFQQTGGLITRVASHLWPATWSCWLVDYVDSLETTLCFLLNESWHICLFTWHLPCSMLVYSPYTFYGQLRPAPGISMGICCFTPIVFLKTLKIPLIFDGRTSPGSTGTLWSTFTKLWKITSFNGENPL